VRYGTRAVLTRPFEGSATLRCFALALCWCDTALAPCSPAF